MQKPDKPMDPIEDVENILKRLTPSALSERATRANESMIDGLAGHLPTGDRAAASRQYWWQAGIAAILMAGAGLVFLNQDSTNNTNSLELASDEICYDKDDGNLLSAYSYLTEDTNQCKIDGLSIVLTHRENGTLFDENSSF
jgi:hypothetical protein